MKVDFTVLLGGAFVALKSSDPTSSWQLHHSVDQSAVAVLLNHHPHTSHIALFCSVADVSTAGGPSEPIRAVVVGIYAVKQTGGGLKLGDAAMTHRVRQREVGAQLWMSMLTSTSISAYCRNILRKYCWYNWYHLNVTCSQSRNKFCNDL